MTIAIVGAQGQLGRDLINVLPQPDTVPLDHQRIEIRDRESVDRAIREVGPDVIVNCAAYNRVDEAEDKPGEAFAVNAEGVLNLARAAERCGATLLHISTDFVFGGEKRTPYAVTDPPAPRNVYGLSKLAGEWMARRYASKHVIVRTCGLYGIGASRSKGTNFVDTMIRLARNERPTKVVNDQIVCPTSTRDLALGLVKLIESGKHGAFHMTNAGQCSWFEFAQEVFTRMGKAHQISPIPSSEYPMKATRPEYSVLDNRQLTEIGISPLRHWREALHSYLDQCL